MASISGLTFNDISSSMGKASASVETSLRNKITSIQNSDNVTSADMLSLQADMTISMLAYAQDALEKRS